MKYFVVGDVHGDLNQFIYPLIEFLKSPKNSKIIYLGDYFDRGDSDVYIYELILFITRMKNNNNIILLRGNHECNSLGTYDFLGHITDNKSKGVIVSFPVEHAINTLDLPLFHYEEEMNILFSHSPQSNTSIEDLFIIQEKSRGDMRLQTESTFTKDQPLDPNNVKYYNVHGHDHTRSSNDDIKTFFSNDKYKNVTMISLDNDASYGFRVINNISKLCHIGNNNDKFVKPFTKLFYVTFNYNDKFENINIVEKNIKLHSNEDLNSISFNELKNVLMKYDNIFEKMTLDSLYEVFESKYKTIMMNISPDKKLNIVSLIDFLYKKAYNFNYERIYFHNIPYEYYEKLGYKGEYKPPWVFFWNIVKPIYYDGIENINMLKLLYDISDNIDVNKIGSNKTDNNNLSGGELQERFLDKKINSKLLIILLAVIIIVIVIVVIIQKILLNKANSIVTQ